MSNQLSNEQPLLVVNHEQPSENEWYQASYPARREEDFYYGTI